MAFVQTFPTATTDMPMLFDNPWLTLLAGAALIGLAFGAVAAATRYCNMGAVSDWVLTGDPGRMRAWLLSIAVAVLGVALLARLVLEWRRYSEGTHLITRRQLILRAVSAADLVVLLGLVAIGARVGFVSAEGAAVYWTICLVLAFVAIVLALWDLRLLRGAAGRRRAQSMRRLSQYIRRLEQSRGGQVPPP